MVALGLVALALVVWGFVARGLVARARLAAGFGRGAEEPGTPVNRGRGVSLAWDQGGSSMVCWL